LVYIFASLNEKSNPDRRTIMAKDNNDPFNPYVQELQGQEGEIEKKLKS